MCERVARPPSLLSSLVVLGVLLLAPPLNAGAQDADGPQRHAADSLQAYMRAVFSTITAFESVTVTLDQGVAKLSGSVHSSEASEKAEQLAGGFDGILYVENNLETAVRLKDTWLESFPPARWPYLPSVAMLFGAVLLLWFVNRLLLGKYGSPSYDSRLGRQLIMLVLTVILLIVAILLFPSEKRQDQLITVLGLVLTVSVTLASTTFVSNAMAGLMLRAVGNFRRNDWVSVEQHFGAVSERGLFHTEIETEEGDLVTIPNMYLVNHPVTVVPSSGTRISATLSIGYDQPRTRIKDLLKEAAETRELLNPLVHVMELGDYAVTYRVSGGLSAERVKGAPTERSMLRCEVLDTLHAAGVEVVSPTIMDQRRLPEGAPILPPEPILLPDEPEEPQAEAVMFRKANLGGREDKVRQQIQAKEAKLADAEADARARYEREIDRLNEELDLIQRIQACEAQLENAEDQEQHHLQETLDRLRAEHEQMIAHPP